MEGEFGEKRWARWMSASQGEEISRGSPQNFSPSVSTFLEISRFISR